MSLEARIKQKLSMEFDPQILEVVDDSEAHRGHGGFREGEQTHFNVMMRAKKLEGLSRVAAQRLVMATLKAEFEDGLHALALDIKAA